MTAEQIIEEYKKAWMASMEFYTDSNGQQKYNVNADTFRKLFPFEFKSMSDVNLAWLTSLADDPNLNQKPE